MAWLLPSRCVLRVSGADAATFLQGLVTADVRSLFSPTPAPLRLLPTAVLAANGRILFHALLRPAGGGDGGGVTAEVCSADAAPLASHLKRYTLRARVSVDDDASVSPAWAPARRSESEALALEPPEPHERWAPDPRSRLLGHRSLLPASAAASLSPAPEGLYDVTRLSLGFLEGAAELAGELPAEACLDVCPGHTVSFAKGCYIGQELTSRTHFRGVVRKRALPLFVQPATASGPTAVPHAMPARGEDVVDAATGRVVGRILAASVPAGDADAAAASALPRGARGVVVACLRLEAVGKGELCAASGARLGVARPPEWWPPGLVEAGTAGGG